MKIVVGIPARMASSRFHGKPLCDILGMPMIEHVYKRCELSGRYTFVATCDNEIYNRVKEFGGNVIMTNPDISRPGLRIAQACKQLDLKEDDIVIVAQGDEPLIHPDMIEEVIQPLIFSWDRDNIFCTHLITDATQEELEDTNEVKAIINNSSDALYFSRAPIPSNIRTDDIPRLKQVCVFAFRYKDLLEFYKLEPTRLELAESIEMLRIIEHGKLIRLIRTNHKTKSVDTEEDRKIVEEIMKNDGVYKKYS